MVLSQSNVFALIFEHQLIFHFDTDTNSKKETQLLQHKEYFRSQKMKSINLFCATLCYCYLFTGFA